MRILTNNIPDNVLIETRNLAQRMNRVRETPGWYAHPTIRLSFTELSSIASDLLRIKKIICSLPQLLNLNHHEFLKKLGERTDLLDFSKNEALDWKTSFFRPDCVLTPQGLKVLEMNIDNGSMAMYGGMALKSFYKMQANLPKYLASTDGLSIDDTLDIEGSLYRYFRKIQESGKKIYFWDLSIRSESIKNERDREITFLKNKGIEINLVLGKEILEIPLEDSYVFRYFAYPHVFKRDSNLPKLFSQIPETLFKNGDLGVTSALYDNKVNLALLWTKSIQSYLSASDIELIKKYIPETYVIDNNLPILSIRSDWVLKQGIGFQGAQVLLGSECSQEQWELAISKAKNNGPFVMQKRVHSLNLNVEATDGHKSKCVGQNHILNMFFVDNKFSGSWFRLASNSEGKVGAIDSETVLGALPIVLA